MVCMYKLFVAFWPTHSLPCIPYNSRVSLTFWSVTYAQLIKGAILTLLLSFEVEIPRYEQTERHDCFLNFPSMVLCACVNMEDIEVLRTSRVLLQFLCAIVYVC